MQRMERSTLVGVFADRNEAARCMDELLDRGFREDQIGFMMQDADGRATTATAETERHDDGDVGAGGGMLAGALTGGLVGAAMALFVPAVGPVLAGGILAASLSGAAIGAVTGGVAASLIDLGVSEDEARYYEGEVQTGRALVTVRTDGRYDEARAIMESHGAFFDEATAGLRMNSTSDAAYADRRGMVDEKIGATGQTIELKEEELYAHKTPVETGEVVVRKEIITENRTIEVPVTREEVTIERRAVDRPASDAAFREGEQTLRIPETEEQVTIEKRPVVREEIEISKRQVTDKQRMSDDVRREEVRIERTGDVDLDNADMEMEKERLRRQRLDQERRSA